MRVSIALLAPRRVFFSLCLAMLGGVGLPVNAQFESTGNSNAQSNSGASGSFQNGDSAAGGGAGGAAMADFDTLMNLIQQTVDPDSWLAAGGTSSILPYPAGVYVDPAGHLQRIRETEHWEDDLLLESGLPRHPWKTSSGLRTVSLKKLDQAIFEATTKGLSLSTETIKLAGLSSLEYVKIDVANEDVLLAGPAGERAFGFELQDLAVVAALIRTATEPLGCSIEPSDAGLLAAQDYIQQAGSLKRLGRNPQFVVEQMNKEIGPHKVKVFGMNPGTGTAVALLDADEHMKKVGFGTVRTRLPINSYFDFLDQQNSIPQQSLIRWWFAYSDAVVHVNATHDLFQLPDHCVSILSEQQWVTNQGRAPTGAADPAAVAFAEGLTKHLDALRKTHPSYARLCAVFEMGLALQLVTDATGQPNLQAWFPTLCGLGATTPEENVEPRTVEGLTTWKRLRNGTVVAVVSGGVKLDPVRLAKQANWQTSRFLVSSLVPEQPERPSTAHGRWWWDQP